MPEQTTKWSNTLTELMRSVSYDFDDNTIIGVSPQDIPVSIPMTTLGEKARLLNWIQGIFVSGAFSSSDILEQENMQLRSENRFLYDAIRKLEERLAIVEASLPTEKIVVLREISKEDAEKEIISLFSEGQTLYYSDIADRLRIDLQLVVEICDELLRKGEIKVLDDKLWSR